MAHFDFIVAGSGVSGMVFAQIMAAEGKKVLVLEKSERAGGCLASATYDNFWLELGGHTVYASYASYISAMKHAGLEENFLPRKKVPFRMLTSAGLVPITKCLNKLELALNVPSAFFTKKAGKTVREYYTKILGRGNYEKMFRPMIAAVISQEGSDFPADMMLKSRPKDKSLPRSFTLKGGMTEFINKAAKHGNINLKTSCGVESVSLSGGVYSIVAGGETFTSDNFVSAVYPAEAGRLLADVAPEASEILIPISSAKVESMGVIIKKEDVAVEELSFIIAADSEFTSVVSRDVAEDSKYRGFAFHFKPDRLTYEQKIAVAEKVLKTDKSKFAHVAETVHFCPTLKLGHEERMDRLDEIIQKVKGLYVTGNWFTGLAIEDCAFRSTAEANRAF
ncbi:protoporphyrinogen/coproporphyrinogen oxidase [Seleniivibrio woodruffii]|uniref:Protoporphyrinogen oxidase n=1 Tax=Seleniivibrio woodruffii TaxID=1078050 RepID=A0A4R1KDC3_9BACT|nr:FAD-dependent oxidoreductase [Seleniivibrio woodruffii]TCK62097.1 protoporphyrinogen oxidase [Seleniivibrio woodruffii]TVZ34786.1 protoporphyrinogen oxidase [Seleniivibrio woodruffii]